MKGSAGISLEEVDFTRTRLPGGGGGWFGGGGCGRGRSEMFLAWSVRSLMGRFEPSAKSRAN
jgi:hypothetical protein